MHHIVVVGSGFSGGILARKLAEELNFKVTVVEKRPHIAGNMYDSYDDSGILIQKFGPHFFHTNRYETLHFLEQYSELVSYNVKFLSVIDGNYVRLPYNYQTVQQLCGLKHAEILLAKFRRYFSGRDRVPIFELINHCDADISAYANLLFDKAYRTYTAKQWGVGVDQVDKYVLERVPMALGYDERYLSDDFQVLPRYGYTKLFETMLSHPNITVLTSTDALERIAFDNNTGKVTYDGVAPLWLIYTGPIDELFSCKYGSLPYRSIDFRYEYSEAHEILPADIVVYPQAAGYTRKTEYKKFTFDPPRKNISMVVTEYPMEYRRGDSIAGVPYYPVASAQSARLYQAYSDAAADYSNLVLCGRLAEFKYYNMDVCVEHALCKFKDLKNQLRKER